MSIADKIRNSSKRCEDVEIKDVGTVKIRHMSVKEVTFVTEIKDLKEGTRQLVAAAVLDENEKPVFENAEQVLDADWQLVKQLAEEVCRVNGISKKAEEKNSQAPSSSDADQQS